MGTPRNGAPRREPAFSGTELRRLRMLTGLTQRELAALVPAHRVTLARWESGTRRISPVAEARLRAVFDELRRAGQEAERAHRPPFDWYAEPDIWG
jgi:DNA-binding transcriptional regulator YiaG